MIIFEASWEVMNKQGGIFTCISEKAKYEVDNDQDYYMLGPLLANNSHKMEYIEPLGDIKRTLDELSNRGIETEYGLWHTNGAAVKTILLSMKSSRHLLNTWKNDLWNSHSINTFESKDEILNNSILFGGLVALWTDIYAFACDNVTLHCHEWQSSVAILKLQNDTVKTILTMHSTSLGRYLCYNNPYFYQHMSFYDPIYESEKKGIKSIHDIERYSVNRVCVLTSVSLILTNEIEYFLKRSPDIITCNGLSPVNGINKKENRKKLDSFVGAYFKDLDVTKTRYVFISGRLEIINKGYDTFLKSMERVNSDETIVCFLITSICQELKYTENSKNFMNNRKYSTNIPVSPHTNLHDLGQNGDSYDDILRLMDVLGDNKSDKIKLVHHANFLTGDNIFNMDYSEFISGCDLGIFPSYYEPWGYTPTECLLRHTPAITSDLSGMGSSFMDMDIPGLSILHRKGRTPEEVTTDLANIISENISKKYNFPGKIPEILLWESAYETYTKARNMGGGKIKIISLKRSLDRRHHIKTELRGLDYNIFDAVDGRNLSHEDNILLDKYIKKDNDPGRYGNSLSHIRLLLDFLDSSRKYQIIFEDDVVYTDKFKNFIANDNIKKLDFDMITFGNFNERRDGEYLGEFSDVHLHYSLYNCVTHGYMVSRKGAEKILKNLEENKLDTFLDYRICNLILQNKAKVITTKPPVVEQVWQIPYGTYNLPTLIWTEQGTKNLKEADTHEKRNI